MIRYRGIFSIALATTILLFSSGGASAETAKKPFLRIFYYRENKRAHESFLKNAVSVDVLAPQVYEVSREGKLNGIFDEEIRAAAKKRKVKVMPLVANGGFSTSTIAVLLGDPLKQDVLISTLIMEARDFSYWGWQFDFEQMDVSLRNPYSDFVAKAYREFSKNNLVLSVAVVAQHSSSSEDYPNDLWKKLVGVYDYAALAKNADFISVMAYDDPSSPGPVAGLPWVKKVIDYSLNYIPPEKLSLGIPLYYWIRDDKTDKIVDIGGYEGIKKVWARYKNVTKHYSRRQRVPYLEFVKQGKNYTLWYENGMSIGEKIALIRKFRLHGFSAWALGLEEPSIYGAIKR